MSNNTDSIKHFMHGSIAGACGVLVSHPFDTIKTNIQKNQLGLLNYRNLYNGVGIAILGMSVEKSVVFGVQRTTHKYLNGISDEYYLQKQFVSGGLAGFTTSLVVTPFEQVKVMMQTGSKTMPRFSGMKEMIRYYYRGLYPVLSRETPGFAVYFPVFEFIKRKFQENNMLNIYTTFLAGASAGVISWIPIYPQDTIKTIIQTNTSNSKPTMRETFKILVKDGNFINLYKGFSLVPLRVVPLHGTILTVMELFKENSSDNDDLL